MGFGGVVLFEYTVSADLLEKDFDQVGAVPLVINNQDASLFFHRPKKFRAPAFLRRCSIVNNPKKKSLRSHGAWAVIDAVSGMPNGAPATMPSTTRSITAAHVMLWFAFTIKLTT